MTRKEALEVMREKLPWLTEDTKRLVMTLVPELAESEDERIRKELKEAFEAYDIESKWNGIPIRSIFAWLEKQKEPLPIPDKFSELNSLMLQYFQSAVKRNDDTEIESDTDLWGRKILDYVRKHDEKQKESLGDFIDDFPYSDEQKEQKPEWNEEDEKMLTKLLLTIEPSNNYDEMRNWLLLKLKALLLQGGKDSLQTHWKPSEEQMKALEAATVRYQSTGLESLYEDLKKLL